MGPSGKQTPPGPARRAAAALLAAGVALGAILGVAGGAAAQDKPVRMQMAGAYAHSMPVLGPAQVRIVDLIRRLSAGSIEVRYAEPGEIIPGREYFNAVATGTLDAAYTAAGFFARKDAAFALFSGVPFGPDQPEFVAWMEYGGGNQLMWDLHEKFGIVARNCGLMPAEGGGWFNREIRTADDFRGLKMRILGLGAAVLRKLGAETSSQRGGEIFQALELGTIDATEFSAPTMDMAQEFHRVAKFYYFPGWHQQTSLSQLYISKAKWAELSDQQKLVIEQACKANMLQEMAEGAALQPAALRALKDKGVQFRDFPPEVLLVLEAKWREVVAEESAKSENFRKVWAAYAKFRADHAMWRDRGYLK